MWKKCFFSLSIVETKKLKKRKGDKANENPAKRNSCGPGDLPDQLVHADPTALGNFADEKKLEEPLLDQPQGGTLASRCCSGTSNPDSPEEDTNVQSQPEGKIKAHLTWTGHCIVASVYVKSISAINFTVSCQFVIFCLYVCQHFSFLWLNLPCDWLILSPLSMSIWNLRIQ
mgnify:CR=1 FL=1